MKMDIAEEIGAVVRSIESREHEGKNARVLAATRSYDTTPDDLWDAITNPERIPRWFMPISGELRLGGRYQLHGNAGGTINRCVPPRELALTWEMGGEISWVEVRLEARGRRTELQLEHIAHVDDPRWDEYGPGAVGVGWELGLWGLARHVSGAAPVDHAAAEAWTSSPDGKSFMRQSSDAWGEASIVAGTDPAIARAAAARTTAAYTGEPG